MDYKKEIETLLNEIQSEKFLKFLYNIIVSFKCINDQRCYSSFKNSVECGY